MRNPTVATDPADKDLTVAIIRDPIVVSPNTTVREAIARMSEARAFCDTDLTAQVSGQVQLEARSSCVVVVEDSRVVGILSERDVVQLCAKQQSLDGLLVSQAMASSVVALRESALKDFFSVIHLLQQQDIRHLLIVDGRDSLVGLVTHETLRQILQPTDLLRLRLVREVMTPVVITSTRTDSLLTVAQRMAKRRVSSVVVVKQDRPEDLPIPLGIVTERDLVQFQALELDFEYYQAAQVMSYPVISVPETETLVTVQQLMKRYLIRRVVVTGDAGELLGIVTQTDILQALSPLELYKLTEVLEAKVKQLESEKIDLLENRAQQLEEQVVSRTADLQKQLQREQAAAQLATQIRSSLSLPLILETAVEQIHQIIGCDRVNIWQFEPDFTSVSVAESTHLPESLIGERVSDPCFQSRFAEVYREGYVRVISDIYTTEMTECHRALLIRLKTRAQVMLPLFCGEQLWGLLSVSEQQFARDWQADEVELLRHLSTQLTIAIQQASTHEQLQSELEERQRAEMQLRRSAEQLRQGAERLQEAQRIAKLGNWELDLQHNTLHWSEEVFRILEIDLQQFSASYEAFLNLVHPEELHIVDEVYSQHLYNRQPYNLEHRLQMTDGRIKYVRQQCETIYSTDGSPLISRGTIQDITQQKEAEMRRDRAEASLRQVIEGTATFTGEAFFPALVSHVAKALGVRYVSVSQAMPDGFQVLAFSADGALCPPPFLAFDAVPCCTQALKTGQYCCPGNISALYPDNALFNELGVDSYLGIGLRNAAGDPIGNLCILHDAPIADPDWARTLLSIFAARAGAELERLITAQALEQLNAELEERVAKRTDELKEREAQLSDLFDNATDLIQSITPNGKFLFVNRAWRETLGYTAADLEHLTILDIIHPDELPHCQQAMQELFCGSLCLEIETRFLTKNGREIVVDGNVNCQMQDGQPIATRGIFRDITARKQAEAALRESQQFLQTVLDTVPLSVFWKDQESRYLGANVRFLADASLTSASELVGKNDFDMPWGATEAEAYRADDRSVIETGEAKLGILETLHRRDGMEIWLETNKLPLLNLTGNIVGVLGTYQDITMRRNAELALQRQLAAIEAAVDGIAILQDDCYLYLNSSHVKMFGYEEAGDLIGQSWHVLYSPEELEHFEQEIFPILLVQRSWQGEVTGTRKDGSTFPQQLSLTFSADNLLICVCQDISARKRAEEALLESNLRFAMLAQAAPVAIFRFDLEGRCIYVNEFWAEMTGRPIAFAMGNRWLETLHPDDQNRTRKVIQRWLYSGGTTLFQNEARILRPDGRIVWFYCQMLSETDTKGQLIGYVGTLTDISDRKAAETLIRQQAEEETLLREITQRIRQSLDLQTIFDTACHEIRRVLQTSRVSIFKFYSASNYDEGEFVAESTGKEFSSVIKMRVHDHCFGENCVSLYEQGKFFAIDDIDSSGLEDCHSKVLARFGIRANLVVPLQSGHHLWGLLCVHQCSAPRQWQETEIAFVQQIATQLGIAIQQASLYEQVQAELQERKQAESEIARQLGKQRALATITELILRQSLDLEPILATVTHQVKEAFNGDRVIIFRLNSDGRSQIVEEAVADGLPNLKDKYWDNEVWSQDILDYYWQGQPRIVPDVMTDRWTKCLVDYAIEGQIQSKIVAPILQEIRPQETHQWVSHQTSNKLWGILVIHACVEKRVWLETEAQLLQQIANQVAIAIQQASLFEQLQQELTERKQAQTQLTERNQQLAGTNTELARATRLKDEFLANMSHELRTPLNAILGMSEGLQDEIFGIVNEKQVKALRTIESSANHLLSLINDILDVAKIESGQVKLDYSQVSIAQLCSSSLTFIKQQALNKRIQLKTNIPSALPDLYVDEIRMRQVLLNLLTNAVKFTPEGGTVTLSVSPLPQPQETNPFLYLRIAVTDTGIGITPENIPKLFKPFVQIDGALNRQQTGTGLGLALAKQIVELHGGQVGLTSEFGVGSCFTIDLPYELQVPSTNSFASAPIPIETALATLHTNPMVYTPFILLAEDNPANVATMTSYLEAKGYRFVIANNGQDAIDLAWTHHPDVILMDIQMPGMDGLEAMKQIRQQESLRQTPIIALTALAMKGDQEKCLAAGADRYLSKPIRLKQLDMSIQELLANRRSAFGDDCH